MVLQGMVWYGISNNMVVVCMVVLTCKRGSGLMVNVLDSRSRGPDSHPGWDLLQIVFLGKTLCRLS